MCKSVIENKILGSLLAGAMGDALGYPVEFMTNDEIQRRFGSNGIREYALNDGVARVSDDTQMTMFTACGILRATTDMAMNSKLGSVNDHIKQAYFEWLQTQMIATPLPVEHTCWIRNIEALQVHRAPGTTCLSALDTLRRGRKVNNDSKGCGAIMRIAPIALHAAARPDSIDYLESIEWAAEASKLTHKHPLGWLSAALAAHMIYKATLATTINRNDLTAWLADGIAILRSKYAEEANYINELENITSLALRLASYTMNDAEAIEQIGGGWVAEETLAIALYCTSKYINDLPQAIIASVNHSGDSDSTGAVTGNLIGALLGADHIPEYCTNDLEFTDTLTSLATDLATPKCPTIDANAESVLKDSWFERYVNPIV